jgi:glycosyltransferase involved in cell wall biosynthesis
MIVKPLVSILIPAFNAQQWIGDTLQSAIHQTWEPKEVIVVDDGSTDQTLKVARQFESGTVRVVTKTNEGAAATRNRCYSLAAGDYIQWLDADDLLAPDKITRQIAMLDRGAGKRTLLSSGWAPFFYRHDRADFVPTALWCDLSPLEWLIRKLGQNLHMQTATWLVSRELTEAAGPWDTRLLGDDDGEYFCRVLLASDGVRFIPGPAVYYRQLGSSSLSYIGRSERKMVAQWCSMELHIARLRALEDSDRVRTACLNYLQNWLINFYPERLDLVRNAEQMASELGGRLQEPRLSWKYSWIKSIFGWNVAKRARVTLPDARRDVERFWDGVLFRIENRAGVCSQVPARAQTIVSALPRFENSRSTK